MTDLSPGRLVAPLNYLMLLNDYDVDAHFEARATVDLDLVRFASRRASAEERGKLLRLAEDGQRFVDQPIGFRVLDFEFHSTINEAARNPLLKTVAQGLYEIALEVRRVATETPGVIETSVGDHLRIAVAIAGGRTAEAVEAYRVHLEHTRETTKLALRRMSDCVGCQG